MNCSTPGSPVLHYLPEFALTHVNWVGNAIQASHPLSTPFSFCLHSFPASGSFPMSWLFSSGAQIIAASASVLPMNIQGWFPLGLTGSFLLSKGCSESSLAPEFKSINSLVLSLLCGAACTSIHICWENHSFDYTDLCWQSNVSAF